MPVTETVTLAEPRACYYTKYAYCCYGTVLDDGGAYGHTDVYASKRLTRGVRDNVSRARPAEPLWMHPTELPLVRSIVEEAAEPSYGLLGFIGSPSPCTSEGTKWYYGMTSHNFIVSGTPMDIYPEPDWVTPMRLKIKDMKVNLGTTLAEYRDTVDMFGRYTGVLADVWNNCIRRKRRCIKATPCNIPGSYLEATWGVKPLSDDLFDSLMALEERVNQGLWRRFCVTVSDEVKFEHDGGYELHSGTLFSSKRAIAYVKFSGHIDKFTGGNPAEWIWETILFSHVVDWAIDVGGYLSALDALRGVDQVVGTVSERRFWREKGQFYIPGCNGQVLANPATRVGRSHSRDVIDSIPLPPLPKWDPSSSYRKVMSMLAVLWQMKGNCKPGGRMVPVKVPKRPLF